LLGPPGCAKTMFLFEISRLYKESLFVIGSNATKAGLLNQLFDKKPKFVLIDELEKMNNTDQTCLLNLMETGIISETKIRKTRQLELSTWVFGSANSCDKIPKPLLSRFVVLELPEYTFEEFREIAVSLLKKENIGESTAVFIANSVWNELGSRDIRDALKVGQLARNPQDILSVIKIMKTFHRQTRQKEYFFS
jgi:replication-associated recombination protein RarA